MPRFRLWEAPGFAGRPGEAPARSVATPSFRQMCDTRRAKDGDWPAGWPYAPTRRAVHTAMPQAKARTAAPPIATCRPTVTDMNPIAGG